MASSEEIVREMCESRERGDFRRVVDAFGEDCEVELIGPGSIPYAGEFHGREGLGEMLGKLAESSELLEIAPDEYHTAGDFVTVIGHERGRSKATGREWTTPLVETYEVRDGKIHRLRCMYDTAAVEHAFDGTSD